MTTWRRQIGLVDDAEPGGSAFDDLVAGAIPDADTFLAVENANVTGGDANLDRNAEIRGRRGSPSPIEFRANPSVDLEAIAYPHLVKKFARLWTGGTDSPVGVPPAAITHALEAIESGELPGIHLGVVRDEQYDKVAGCTCNTFGLNFPLLEHAKITAQLRGKYRKRVATGPPAASYDEYPRRGLLLRDAKTFIDGSPTPLPGLRGMTFNFDNQMAEPDYWSGHNVVVTTISGEKKRVWWPQRHKFMGHSITGQIMFSAPDMDQDLRLELAHQEQLVFECEFEDLAGVVPAAVEVVRITGEQMVRTEGGPEQLTKQDEITSTYSFGLFVDEATGDDAVFEFVDGSDDPIV